MSPVWNRGHLQLSVKNSSWQGDTERQGELRHKRVKDKKQDTAAKETDKNSNNNNKKKVSKVWMNAQRFLMLHTVLKQLYMLTGLILKS